MDSGPSGGTSWGIAYASKARRSGVEEHIACRFKFLVDRRRLYLAGRKDARDGALDEFEMLGALGGLIAPRTLDNEHVAQGIFGRLRRQHGGNFIKRLRTQFSPRGSTATTRPPYTGWNTSLSGTRARRPPAVRSTILSWPPRR